MRPPSDFIQSVPALASRVPKTGEPLDQQAREGGIVELTAELRDDAIRRATPTSFTNLLRPLGRRVGGSAPPRKDGS